MVVAELRAAGIRVAGIANNHAGDAGPGGVAATARALREGGVTPTGLSSGVAVVLVGGLRVAIAAYDLGAAVPTGLAAELRRARRGADVLVATFHVTARPSYLPTPVLEQAVERALEAGAAVVAAHGTHMIGPVERRGRAVVVWGLGNLAFACPCTQETDGLLVEVELGADGAGAATVIPIQAGLAGAPVAPAPDASGIFDLLRALGSRFARVDGSF
jgi:poly-gamma-glutamate synthesis protein (capsule biosynthesis protein)